MVSERCCHQLVDQLTGLTVQTRRHDKQLLHLHLGSATTSITTTRTPSFCCCYGVCNLVAWQYRWSGRPLRQPTSRGAAAAAAAAASAGRSAAAATATAHMPCRWCCWRVLLLQDLQQLLQLGDCTAGCYTLLCRRRRRCCCSASCCSTTAWVTASHAGCCCHAGHMGLHLVKQRCCGGQQPRPVSRGP